MVTPQQYRGSEKQKKAGRVPENRNFSTHLSDNPQEGKRNHVKKKSAQEKDIQTSGVDEADKRRGEREMDNPGFTHYDHVAGEVPRKHRESKHS
jgi:hypothetical protein